MKPLGFAVVLAAMPATAFTQLSASTRPEASLREIFSPYFSIGFGTEHVSGAREDLLRHHASSVSCENSLKARALRPAADKWNWEKADAWVDWATSLGLDPVGHTLVWCYRMPEWLLDQIKLGKLTKAEALRWQDEHIRSVLGRYEDRIRTWDVVNEALSDAPASDDTLLRSDPWSDLCGEDYIIEAFRSARAAAPNARLIYNDYNLEMPAKRARLFRLLRRLEAEGCRPDAIGIQCHGNLEAPTIADLQAAIVEIHAAGYPVHITELDVSVYSWKAGANLQIRAYDARTDEGYAVLPDEIQQRLAGRYRDLFSVFLRHADKIGRVSFWNIDDGNTWLRNWPVRGRLNYPLLFDAQQRPKPAFDSVVSLVENPKAPAPGKHSQP
ncbi:MAG: endo-1,4-beta-xylanase [Verrucomicrobiota bacterium]